MIHLIHLWNNDTLIMIHLSIMIHFSNNDTCRIMIHLSNNDTLGIMIYLWNNDTLIE